MRSTFSFHPGKQFSPFLFLFIVASIFLFSCQKTDRMNIDSSAVTEAKNWFSTNVLAGESRMLAKPFSELPKTAPERVLARMNKLSKKLDWSKAIAGSADKLDYILVPLQKDDLQLKGGYFMKRALVFYRYNNAPMQMQVVELLTKNQLATNFVRLAASLFERKVAGKQLPVQPQDVEAFFYDKEYKTLDAYEIKNNKWKPLQVNCLNKTGGEQLTAESENGSNCAEWGVFRVTYDGDGNEIERELLYTYWVCSGPNGDDPPEEQPEPDGGGGEENDDVSAIRKTANFEWEFWRLNASEGGGTIRVIHYVVGRFYPNKPEKDKFIGGYFGGEVIRGFLGEGTTFLVNDSYVAVNSQTEVTAHMTGTFTLDGGIKRERSNSISKDFSEIRWPL